MRGKSLSASLVRLRGLQHLKEGLALNQDRQRLYSNLTEGATKEVSAELIYLEKMSVLGSYSIFNLDAQGATLESKGIHISFDRGPFSQTFAQAHSKGQP